MAGGKPEVIVPGFPEIVTFQPMCRVCQMARTKPGLAQIIHKYRRDEQLGVVALATKITEMLERHGETKMHPQVIRRHFKSHVDFGEGQNELPAEDYAFVVDEEHDKLSQTEIEMLSTNPEDLALGRNDSDYHNMADLFRRLLRRVAALDADPTAFITAEGRHDMSKLNIWAAMINTAKGVLSDLNKMRNSDRLTISILESHTKSFTAAIAGPLATALLPIHQELARHPDPNVQAVAGKVQQLLQSGVVDIFRRAADESLRKSKEQFKLLN